MNNKINKIKYVQNFGIFSKDTKISNENTDWIILMKNYLSENIKYEEFISEFGTLKLKNPQKHPELLHLEYLYSNLGNQQVLGENITDGYFQAQIYLSLKDFYRRGCYKDILDENFADQMNFI